MKSIPIYALVFPLVLALVACGGGSSGTDSSASADKPQSDKPQSDKSQSDKSQSNNYGFGETSPELKAITDKIEIIETPKMKLEPSYQEVDGAGITFEFTKYVVQEPADSLIYVRVDNGSSKTLGDIHCAISAWKDGEQINTANLNFSPMTVDPGESGMDSAAFYKYDREGFKGFDKLSLDSCNHTAFEREKLDLANGPVKVEFVEFGDTRADITLSLTNNKPHPIGIAKCVYDAKIGNIIVAMASISFRGAINKSGNIIEPGETVVKSTTFSGTKSVKDFDSVFDYENLNCSYHDRK